MRSLARSAVLLALVAALAEGQSPLPAWAADLPPGVRLRVKSAPDTSQAFVGALLALSADSVFLGDQAHGGARAIAFADIARVEKPGPRQGGNVWAGMGKGFLIGAGVGGLSGIGCKGLGCLGAAALTVLAATTGTIVGGVRAAGGSSSWVSIYPAPPPSTP